MKSFNIPYAANNLKEYILHMNALLGLKPRETENLIIALNKDKTSLFNYVFCKHVDSCPSVEEIKEVQSILNEEKSKVTWAIDNASKKIKSFIDDQIIKLQIHGKKKTDDDSMNFLLANKPLKASFPISESMIFQDTEYKKELIFDVIDSEEKLIEFENIAIKVFFNPPNLVKEFFHGVIDDKSGKTRFYVVRTQTGDPVGMCGCFIDSHGVAGFYSDGVLENYRKQGIGRTMINERLQFAHSKGCKLGIAHCMQKSVSMYKKCGFKLYGNLFLYINT